MASTSETGHAKNVAAFAEIIACAKGLGEKYNPSNESLKPDSLELLHQAVKQALNNTKSAVTVFNNATNNRAQLFEPLRRLSTRIVAAFSLIATPAAVADMQAANRKIQGTRAGKELPKTAEGQPAPSDKSISTSQQSFDSIIDHFEKILEMLKAQPGYKPNEAELSIAGLQTRVEEMHAANRAVITAYTGWSNARIARNTLLYNPLTGLLITAAYVKKYIKSVFGAQSPQFKQVSGIVLRKSGE